MWFVTPDEQLAVEVKSSRSNDTDLRRGVYQCVKYRALLEARLAVDKLEARVRARLVSEVKLPSHAVRIAEMLGVEVQVITLDEALVLTASKGMGHVTTSASCWFWNKAFERALVD